MLMPWERNFGKGLENLKAILGGEIGRYKGLKSRNLCAWAP